VEVGERIACDRYTSEWKRFYRIRLHFQSPSKIKKAFGIDFEAVAKTIRGGSLLTKLSQLIRLEQRRSGERSTGLKQDALAQFRSAGGDKASSGKGKSDEDGEGHTDNDDEDAGGDAGKKDKAEVDSESDDDEADDEQDNEAEQGTLKLGSKKEIDGYDDDEESEEEEDEEGVVGAGKKKTEKKNSKKADSDDESSDDDSDAGKKKSSKSAGKKKGDDSDSDIDIASDNGNNSDGDNKKAKSPYVTPAKAGKKGVTFGSTPGKVTISDDKGKDVEALRSQEEVSPPHSSFADTERAYCIRQCGKGRQTFCRSIC
jgi:hypothetical protein